MCSNRINRDSVTAIKYKVIKMVGMAKDIDTYCKMCLYSSYSNAPNQQASLMIQSGKCRYSHISECFFIGFNSAILEIQTFLLAPSDAFYFFAGPFQFLDKRNTGFKILRFDFFSKVFKERKHFCKNISTYFKSHRIGYLKLQDVYFSIIHTN